MEPLIEVKPQIGTFMKVWRVRQYSVTDGTDQGITAVYDRLYTSRPQAFKYAYLKAREFYLAHPDLESPNIESKNGVLSCNPSGTYSWSSPGPDLWQDLSIELNEGILNFNNMNELILENRYEIVKK